MELCKIDPIKGYGSSRPCLRSIKLYSTRSRLLSIKLYSTRSRLLSIKLYSSRPRLLSIKLYSSRPRLLSIKLNSSRPRLLSIKLYAYSFVVSAGDQGHYFTHQTSTHPLTYPSKISPTHLTHPPTCTPS